MPEIRVDVSHEAHLVQEAIRQSAWAVEAAMTAPHVLMRPTVVRDGDKWCALYGLNVAEGVAGFGDTPAEACADFDRAWREERATRPSTAEEKGAQRA